MHKRGIRTILAAGLFGSAVLAWGGLAWAAGTRQESTEDPAVAGISVPLDYYYAHTEDAENALSIYLSSQGEGSRLLSLIGFDHLFLEGNGIDEAMSGVKAVNEGTREETLPPETPAEETVPEQTSAEEPTTEEPTTEAPTEPETSPYANVAVSKIIEDSWVNVRTAPSTVEGEIVGKIRNHCAATILDTVEGENGLWYYIESGSVVGYIKADYFVTGEEAEALAVQIGKIFARVDYGGLRLREEPTTEGDNVITKLWEGEIYAVSHVVESGDEFVQITLGKDDDGNDVSGYVHRDYVSVFVKFDTAISLEEEKAENERKAEEARLAQAAAEEAQRQAEAARLAEEAALAAANEEARRAAEEEARQAAAASASAERSALISTAKQYLGVSYVWGGESLSSGVDCSGFTMKIYEAYGYSLPHYSGSQANCGTRVDLSSIRPGDLIFYARGGVIYHVAIYIGDGQIIHAANESLGVCISNLNYADIYCAVSIMP